MRRPNFLILGAPKCGTTTLFRVLEAHPEILLAQPKEPLFFETEFERGLDYYWERYFSHWNGEPAVGEARAAKLFLPFVAQRIRQSLPEARLIAILRNPVDRVLSHWWMRTCNGKERRSLAEALRQNFSALQRGRTFDGEAGRRRWLSHLGGAEQAPLYLELGHYANQIRTYLDLFPGSQLKFLFFEDLCERPRKLFDDVSSFLGVSADDSLPVDLRFNAAPSPWALALHRLDRRLAVPRWIPQVARTRIKAAASAWGRAPQLDDATRAWLTEHYLESNRELERLTGRDLSRWNS